MKVLLLYSQLMLSIPVRSFFFVLFYLFVGWLFFFPPSVKPSWDVRTLCVLPNKKQDVALRETNNAPYTKTWKSPQMTPSAPFFFATAAVSFLKLKNLTMLSVYALTITHSPGARCYPEHFALLSLKCIYILMAQPNWALFWHGKTRFTLCRKRKRTFFVYTTSWGRKFRRENDNLNIIFVIRTEVLRTSFPFLLCTWTRTDGYITVPFAALLSLECTVHRWIPRRGGCCSQFL